MPQAYVFDDGQSQASTTGFARPAAIHPVKALGQTRQMLGRNTRTRVANHHSQRTGFARLHSNANSAARWRVPYRIGR
jgi:hypothetical protein